MATSTSSGTRHLEMRALYQGFCYLRTSSPPSSSRPSSASWRKRYAVILECGLVFFDPAAGRGSPVDKIGARDMQGVRLLPQDPKGRTLEIFLISPPSTLQVHLCTTSITQHWLHILLHALIPQAHNSIASMRDKEPFSSPPEGVHRLEEAQRASYLGDQNEVLTTVDRPVIQPGGKFRSGLLESRSDVQMPSVSGHPRLSKNSYDSTEDHMKVDQETKRLSRPAQSHKRHTVSSENMLLLHGSYDAIKNCMELALLENIVSRQETECTSSWSCRANMERLSGDILVENNLIPCTDTLSLDQPTGLVVEVDGPSSGPLSMLGSPESESLRRLEESSSEGSISGLTLTSESSDAVEGLALDGSKLQEPLLESSSLNNNKAVLRSGNTFHSNDALPALSATMFAEARPTSDPGQEPSLQRLNKELRASLSLQKVKQSMGPSSLHQEHTQEEDRFVENGEKLKAVKINQSIEKKAFRDVFEEGENFDSEEVIRRPRVFMKRSYLHIHILECWLNEGALDESFQDGAKSLCYFNIVACLYHGGEKLAQSHELSTTFVLGCTNLRWNELLTFPILLYDLPQEVRLNLALYRGVLYSTDQVESKMIGWTNFCFIDENGFFKPKRNNIKLWKDPPFYSCGTVAENTTDDFCGVLSVELDYSAYSISIHQREEIDNTDRTDDENDPPTPTDEEIDLLDTIISTSDVITPPTEAQKHVFWQLRHALVEKSHALPKFLMSVPWNKHHYVLETHRILTRWKPLPPFYALQLLGPQFGDKMVRDYAVDRLRNLTEEEFQLVLIQLVQALVYEPYNNSSLLQLLLERATNWTIGHHLFWLVKTGVQVPFFKARFEFVLEELLRCCKPAYVEELIKQDDFVRTLIKVANAIKPIKSEARKGALRKMLKKVQFIEPISLPLNPMLKVNGFDVEKCKYMDSKKLPLWLVFKNADKTVEEAIYTMFKAGDDLRQDMLTLQLMKIMEKLWSKSSLDLRMNVYGCVSTGLSDGFLEIVWNAETLSNIASKHGGGAKAVFRVETLQNWLVSNNRTGEDYSKAVDNFVRSCAAYCVATCVLGIGDRHNDNVMIKRTGEFFHIDFGHILGHFKSKFGIKRERARFVFTPDMAYVMGGIEDERFKHFQELCGLAFNKLRENAHLFLNLTHLMVSSGIPEIATPQNVYYLRDILVLDLSEEDAKERFNEWIIESLQTTATQVNYAIHTWAHG